MATAAERRKARKQRQQQEAQQESHDSYEEREEGGISPQQRSRNQIYHFQYMTWKTLCTLADLIHQSNKLGIDLGTAGEMEIESVAQELRKLWERNKPRE